MKKQSFMLSSLILIIMVVVTKILGLIYKIPLTNILGGTGYGYYSMAYSVFMPVFSIAVSGITTSMAKLVSENIAFERYKNVRKLRKTALLYFFVNGIVFTLISVAIAYPLCNFVLKQPYAMWSAISISPCILIGCILSVERGYYEGLRNMTPTAVSEIIESLFKIFLGLGFGIWANHNSERFFIKGLPFVSAMCVFGVTIANLISLIVLEIMKTIAGDGITKEMLNKDKSTEKTKIILKKILSVSNPIALASCISTLGGFIDTITINHCLGKVLATSPHILTSKLGLSVKLSDIPNFIYGSYTGLAMTVFGLIPSLTSIFGKSILPIISENWAKGKKREVSKRINSLLLLTAVISFPCAMGIFTYSDEILKILFPAKTAEIIAISESLKILCSGMVFLCMSSPLFSIIQGISKPAVSVRIMLIASGVRLLLNIILVSNPKVNIMGAAISTTASFLVIFILSLNELIKISELKISYRNVFVIPFFASYFCVNLSKFVYSILILRLEFMFSFVISVFFAVILYIFSLKVLCTLTKNEIIALFFKDF